MIEFSLFLMGSFFVLFMFLLLLLNSMLFKPMLQHIDTRKNELLKDQGDADKDNEIALELKEEAKVVIAKAKEEASRIKENAIAVAKDEVEKELASFKEKIATEIEEFEKALHDKELLLNGALLGEAPLFKERLKVKFATAK